MRRTLRRTLASLFAASLMTLSSSAVLAQGGGSAPRTGAPAGRGQGAGAAAGAGHGMMMGPMGGGPGMGLAAGIRAIRELNLTPEQQNQIANLEEQLETQIAPLRSQMATQMTELQSLWSAATPDRNAIVAKQADIDKLHQSMRTAVTDFRLGVLQVLTPDQRAKLSSQHGAFGGAGMGPCPMCGDGG